MRRASRWSRVGLLLLAGCASTPRSAPEATSAPPTEAATPAVGGDDDLASAWAPEEARPAAALAPLPPPPAPIDRSLAFKDALNQAQQALGAKDLDAARASAERACTEAATLSGEERSKAWTLAFRIAQTDGDPGRAQAVALDWRRACGPERVDACRAAATNALASVAKLKGAPTAALKSLVQSLKDADTCVAQAERRPGPAPCLSAAERVAQREKDDLLAARILWVRALAEKNDAKKSALLVKAEARCHSLSCIALRRRVLAAHVALAVAGNDLESAVKLAVRDVEVLATTTPPELRLWVRTPELDKLCAQYDTTAGSGACRRLEKSVTGGWTFRDFSKDRAGDGLHADRVKEVNEHYSPLIQECLSDQARRLVPPDAQRFEVRWVVQNDGRVREAHLRADLDQTELAVCLRKQFTAWRYPRFEGEFQNVEQSFLVKAVERRVNR